MATVTSDQVAEWWGLCEERANRKAGIGGAEFDDLVQEGAIKTWEVLELGMYPNATIIDRALVDYIRYWSLNGRTNRTEEPV